MIYELCVVAKDSVTDENLNSLKDLCKEVMKEYKTELLIEDDWGKRQFAQASKNGCKQGHYLYFMYKGEASALNQELYRRLRINDYVHKFLNVNMGRDRDLDAILKNYKTPFSRKYNGSVTDESEGMDIEKDRRRFARRRNCWFIARSIKADWKDPKTYMWLINEFGKISPARVSGVSTKHQRFVNSAIKRARQLNIVSHLSDAVLK